MILTSKIGTVRSRSPFVVFGVSTNVVSPTAPKNLPGRVGTVPTFSAQVTTTAKNGQVST